MKISLKTYTAGDLSRFYGLSLDTIRFYDKRGILSATKKLENDYRIYNRADLISLDHILSLKHAGIPLKNVNNMVNRYSIEEALEYCRTRIDELDDDIQALRRQRDMLVSYTEELQRANEMWEVITIENSPTMYMKNISGGITTARQWLAKHNLLFKIHLSAYSDDSARFYVDGCLLSEEERSSSADCYLASILPKEMCGFSSGEKEPGDWIWPSQLCLHTYFRFCTNEESVAPDLDRIQNFVKEHNFKLKGDTICWVVFTEKNQSKRIDYYECWYPLEL